MRPRLGGCACHQSKVIFGVGVQSPFGQTTYHSMTLFD